MRVAIFFDGKNFYSGWRDRAGGRKIDFARLSRWIVEQVLGEHLWSVYYYTSVESGPGADVEAQRNLAGFLDMLERQPGFFVKRFSRRQASTTCPECGAETRYTQEKEVDTTMVADMLRLASVGAFDIMVLVSGDADHAPAVENVRGLGKQAYVATWGGTGLSQRIRKAAFDHIDLLDGLERFAVTSAAPDVAPEEALPPPNGFAEGIEGQAPPASAAPAAGSDDDDEESDEDRLLDLFVDEVRRAAQKFTGSYVGLSYFVTRWRSPKLDSSPELRRRLLDRLIQSGEIEVYDAPDGSKAIRLV